MPYLLAVDQSTSATKALLFDTDADLIDKESVEHQQHYPQPGWVEHDAAEIHANTIQALHTLLKRHQAVQDHLLCLSLTNQRETVVVFEKGTGTPLHRAIVWQCRRGNALCERLVEQGHSEAVQAITGLKIDTYFSASKLQWLVENHPSTAQKLAHGEALIGTMDAYLIYRLTQGQVFATDPTNACRTLLYDIGRLEWSPELCELFRVPCQALPAVRESSAPFGQTDLDGFLSRPIPICGVMGDSQAALLAQRCFSPGMAKVTFGTGSSLLLNIGHKLLLSSSGIVSTLAWVDGGQPTYSYEGILNTTGATIAWLKDQLRLITHAAETETLAACVSDSGGVYLVPAFVGLSAPYWASDAKAAIVGLTPHSTKEHVVRAALESIAYQVRDVLGLMVDEAGIPLQYVQADGGMTQNRLLMQLVADITRFRVRASDLPELSALGAVFSGLLGMGVCESLEQLHQLHQLPQGITEYQPTMDAHRADTYYRGWQEAVQRVL